MSITEEAHEITVGDVYKDSRTNEKIELIYLDSNIYVLQNEYEVSHRLGSYQEIEKNVESDRYQYLPEADQFAVTNVDGKTKDVPFEELDSIGESGADNLRKAGFETVADVTKASDEALLDVSWVGEAGVASIREWCDN